MLKSFYYLLIKIGLLRKECIYFTNGQKLTKLYLLSLPFFQLSSPGDNDFQTDNNAKNSGNMNGGSASRGGVRIGEFFISKPKKVYPDKGQRIFYLKIHRKHATSYDCIQHWIDTIHRLNGFIYFVCDSSAMRAGLFEKPCYFYGLNFDFIKSDRKTLKKEVATLFDGLESSKLWKRIGLSMLTPFTHAASLNYKNVYNIDADDIMILVRPSILAKVFILAEKKSLNEKLDCLNLDMFVSKTLGVHWSFGVVLISEPKKILSVIKKNVNWRQDEEAIRKFKITYAGKFNFNVDWFFTFLRDSGKLNLKTFYIEKATVLHMPDRIVYPWWAFVINWSDDYINLPVLEYVYHEKVWNKFKIPESLLKVDVGLSQEEYELFLSSFYHSASSFEKEMANIAIQRELITDEVFKIYKNGLTFPKRLY